MARPREFDEAYVLQKATEVFWQKGYEATSLNDLLDATGLARGSLYKAFKSKRGLFLRVLESYLMHARTRLRQTLDAASSPADGLRAWFDVALSPQPDEQPRCGCFAVNITVELAPHDEEVRLLLHLHDQLVGQMYAQAIESGQRSGHFREDLDPVLAAQWLGVTLYGLKSRSRAGLSSDGKLEIMSSVFDALSP